MTTPPFKVPSMRDIKAIKHNGFNVVSTFSGGGGSCLGYRMAGYKVLWANEFIPAAQETYKANHPDSILDPRDIRTIQPSEILKAINMPTGQLDLFDGSPPCAAFSTAGKRAAKWGGVSKYSDSSQRVDDLFFEYIRLLEGLRPKVFVAENVSGLIKGVAKGYFLEILACLKKAGYNVACKVLDAQWLGVPQQRQRTIFVGVRNDLGIEPLHPGPLPYRYSVRDAWENVPADKEFYFTQYAIYPLWRSLSPGQGHPKRINLKRLSFDKPSNTVCQTWGPSVAAITHPSKPRYPTIAELKRLCAFPDDFVLTGKVEQQWERLGRSVPPVMMMHVAKTIQEEILCKLL